MAIKFHLLPVGRRFRFQGEIYNKVSPLIASGEADGGQRMVPRASLVEPLDGAAPEQEVDTTGKTLDAGQVAAAFEQYHASCHQWLRGMLPEGDEATAKNLADTLEGARRRFLHTLGIDS